MEHQEVGCVTQEAQRREQGISLARFPPELLVDIFTHLALTPPSPMRGPNSDRSAFVAYFKNAQPTVVTQVCRSWRVASLAAKSLWSHLRIDLHLYPMFVYDFLDTFVARALAWSGDAPLDICMRLVMRIHPMSRPSDRIYIGRTQVILNRICQVQNRWRSVEIIPVPGKGYLPLRPAELRSIQVLRLQVSCIRDVDSPSAEITSLPNLRVLHLPYYCNLEILEYIKVDKLEELSIFSPLYFKHGRNRLLLELSKLVSTVRHFVLEDMGVANDDDDDTVVDAKTLFAVVDFPLLEKVTLRGISPGAMKTMTDSIPRYRPPLVSATFYVRVSTDDGGQSIMGFLGNAPSLTHLEIEFSSEKGAVMSSLLDNLASKVDGSFVLVPRLQTLNLQHVSAPLSSFVDLISSRWDVRADVRSLVGIKLTRCGYDDETEGHSHSQHGSKLGADTHEFWEEITRFVEDGLSLQVVN